MLKKQIIDIKDTMDSVTTRDVRKHVALNETTKLRRKLSCGHHEVVDNPRAPIRLAPHVPSHMPSIM
jgi:hypothetical protein